MQITRENTSKTEVKLVITLSEAEIGLAKTKVVGSLAKKIKVPGFRPGKAPAAVAEKNIDQGELQSEVMQEAINQFYPEAIEKEKLRTLGMPSVSITKFVPFSELEFSAVIGIMPEVVLGDYKKIKKTAAKATVETKEIDEVLNNLRIQVSEKKSAERAAKTGDEVVIDFEGTDSKGETVAGSSGKDYNLSLGSKTFIPGFEEGLIGAKKGDDKELKLTFPKDYHAENLAGSKITFKVKVKDVKEVVLPELDDEFAKKISPFPTIKELKADIQDQLTERKQVEADNKVKDEIVEELVKSSKFELPKVLVEEQIRSLEDDFNQNLLYRGITLKDYLKQQKFESEAQWREKELKAQAERRVSVGLVLAAVSEKEGLKVEDPEIHERLDIYKQQYQQEAARFDTPEMHREVASRILTEKTVDLLFDLATNKK